MTTIPEQHLVTITAERPHRRIVGMLWGDDMPDETGGRGGWVATNRARRTPFVEWVGPDVRAYELVIRLLDGATPDVDAAKRSLEKISGMPSEGVTPQIVTVDGHVPIADGTRWAINTLAFSEAQRDENGLYEAVTATISLIAAENLGDGVIVAKRAPSVFVVTKQYNTLQKIATKVYGSPKYAKQLGAAQPKPIRDVRKNLFVPKKPVRLVVP